jgi:hypothetical protein
VKAGTPLLASATAFRFELRWPLDISLARRDEALQQLAETRLPGLAVRRRNVGTPWARGLLGYFFRRRTVGVPTPPALDYEHVLLEPLSAGSAEVPFSLGVISGTERDQLLKANWGTVLDFYVDTRSGMDSVRDAELMAEEAAEQLKAWFRDPETDQASRRTGLAAGRWEGQVPDAHAHGISAHMLGSTPPKVEIRGLRKFGLPVVQLEVPAGLSEKRALLVARALAQRLVERPAPTTDGELEIEVDALAHAKEREEIRGGLWPGAPGKLVLRAALERPDAREPILQVRWPEDARAGVESFFGVEPPKEEDPVQDEPPAGDTPKP